MFYAAWSYLPSWQVVLVALLLYFIPLFQPFKLFSPFFIFLLSAYFLPRDFWSGLLLAFSFFLILGVKNLEILNRRGAQQLLVLALTLAYFRFAFSELAGWGNPLTFAALAVPALLFFLLSRKSAELIFGTDEKIAGRERLAILAVAAFLLWQISAAALFLPLNPAHQVALVFLAAVILLQNTLDFFAGRLDKSKLVFRLVLFCLAALVVVAGMKFSV